jgi:hypothetical protein
MAAVSAAAFGMGYWIGIMQRRFKLTTQIGEYTRAIDEILDKLKEAGLDYEVHRYQVVGGEPDRFFSLQNLHESEDRIQNLRLAASFLYKRRFELRKKLKELDAIVEKATADEKREG